MQFFHLAIFSALALFALNANAQTFAPTSQPTTPAAPKVENPSVPAAAKPTAATKKISAQDILQQIEATQAEPVTMTPEQKAAVKKPLVEQILNDVDKRNLKERRDLMDAMYTLDKTSARRKNLDLPEDQQIKIEKPRVNVKSKQEVQKYMQERLVDPIDRTMNIQ